MVTAPNRTSAFARLPTLVLFVTKSRTPVADGSLHSQQRQSAQVGESPIMKLLTGNISTFQGIALITSHMSAQVLSTSK